MAEEFSLTPAEIRALILEADCSSHQSAEIIRELAERLDSAKTLQRQWPLIVDIFHARAPEVYRLFAHYVSAHWCGTGVKKHAWQMFDALPRNIRYSLAEQRNANNAIRKAARALEAALRNTAVSQSLRGPALGGASQAGVGLERVPVVTIPLAANLDSDDSVLKRLKDVVKRHETIHVTTGWASRPKMSGARATYFARRIAQLLLYDSADIFRSRIERFIADLITEIGNWENSEEVWDSEKVRQSLRKRTTSLSVRSKK